MINEPTEMGQNLLEYFQTSLFPIFWKVTILHMSFCHYLYEVTSGAFYVVISKCNVSISILDVVFSIKTPD